MQTRTNQEEEGLIGEFTENEVTLRAKIKHVLTIYPRLSPSMLQVGIGTGLPAGFWKPILEKMVQEGEVIREQRQATTPSDRSQSYTILHLPDDNDDNGDGDGND